MKRKPKQTPKSVEKLTEAFLDEYEWEHLEPSSRERCSLRAKELNDKIFNKPSSRPVHKVDKTS